MQPITAFTDLYNTVISKRVYRSGIYQFLDCIYGPQRAGKNATEKEMQGYEILAEQYLADKNRDHMADLMSFSIHIGEKPPHTARTYMNVVREFLANNNIEFPSRDLKRVMSKLPKGGARTIEAEMTHETLKTLLTHMDAKGRALIITLASSGMRIGECLQIRINDVDLASEPAQITIRGEFTKTGNQRLVFISKEAVHAIKEWLKVRDNYINSARNRNRGLVASGVGAARPTPEKDPRLFPFTVKTVDQFWDTALRNAGLLNYDETTNRKDLHIHMLRKFFRSQLGLSCPLDVIEELMGHSGYLTGSYRRISKNQLAELYSKNEYRVTIQTPRELQEMTNEIHDKMQTHSNLIVSLSNENLQLKNQIGSILRDMEHMRSLVEYIESDPRFPVLVDQRS